jgi:glycosyltransferase involved in cell wall biosynthesis
VQRGLPRIAIVNDIAGVAEVQVRLLRAAGYEVDFLALPMLGAAWGPRAKAACLPLRLLMYLPVAARLRRRDYDVVHVHFASQGIVAMGSGKPLVIHAHGSDLHLNLHRPLVWWITQRVLRRASHIFYVTPNLRSYLAGFESRAELLGNPIETHLFEGAEPPAQVRRALVFARLEEIKGVGEIFANAREIGSEVHLAALDWGPGAASYRERDGQFVEFLPAVAHDEVPSLLDGFDIVIGQMHLGVPGLCELEAMARCRPVIMRLEKSLYPMEPPPVVHVETGADIAAAVRMLRDSPETARRIGVAGQEWVKRHHSPDQTLAALKHTYEELRQH